MTQRMRNHNFHSRITTTLFLMTCMPGPGMCLFLSRFLLIPLNLDHIINAMLKSKPSNPKWYANLHIKRQPAFILPCDFNRPWVWKTTPKTTKHVWVFITLNHSRDLFLLWPEYRFLNPLKPLLVLGCYYVPPSKRPTENCARFS